MLSTNLIERERRRGVHNHQMTKSNVELLYLGQLGQYLLRDDMAATLGAIQLDGALEPAGLGGKNAAAGGGHDLLCEEELDEKGEGELERQQEN